MKKQNERIPRDEVKVKISKYFGKSIQEIFLSGSMKNVGFLAIAASKREIRRNTEH